MAYPTTSGRGDAVVQVDFGSGLVNWAGTDNFTLSFNNDISKKRVGDTGDWSLPVITIKDVAAQDITGNMTATFAAAFHKDTSDWALNKKLLPVRISFPNAATGEVSAYDGNAFISSLEIGNIGTTDGEKLSENITLEFSGAFSTTVAP